MLELRDYTSADRDETLARMADFFAFHTSLTKPDANAHPSQETIRTLEQWLGSEHALKTIWFDSVSVGFLHIGFRGETVAWIEDIYVDKEHRGKGVATRAIALAEKAIAANKNYTAVCMDVAPRNQEALRLYRRLGYDSLSLMTLRKDFYANARDKETTFMGLDFKY